MSIQVRCPNGACGKMLSVRDDFAGKTGKCPNCGSTMQIPYPDAAGGPGGPPAREERHGDERPPARSRRGRDDDYDDYDDDDRRPARRSQYDEEPARRRSGGPEPGTVVLLSIGAALLVFLGLIPLFPYISVSMMGVSTSQGAPSLFTGDPNLLGTWQGKVLLIVTLLVAVLALVSLILYLTASRGVADIFLTISGCIAGGWGMTALIWLVAIVWKVLTYSSKVKEQMGGMGGMGGMGQISISPGIGMWIGLVVALAVVAIFSSLMTMRGKTLWIYLGEGVGLLLGIVMLVAAVQPWKIAEAGGGMRKMGTVPPAVAGSPVHAAAWPLPGDRFSA